MKSLTDEQLNTLKNAAKTLAERHGLEFLVLYGSAVRGKTHPESDIDVGFVSNESKGLAEIAQMEFDLRRATGFYNIELRDIARTSPLFRKTVAENSILLYEREKLAYARFRMYSLTRYQATKPLRDRRKEAVRRAAQEV